MQPVFALWVSLGCPSGMSTPDSGHSAGGQWQARMWSRAARWHGGEEQGGPVQCLTTDHLPGADTPGETGAGIRYLPRQR